MRGGEYVANGTLHHDTCLQDSKRKTDYCSVAVISLCETGQKGQESGTDLSETCCQHASKVGL